MTALKVAVIGVGSFGRAHVLAWNRVAGARVVAVVDRDLDAIDAFTRESAPEAVALESIEALLVRGDIDCASVVLPSAHHSSAAVALMDAGIDVLIEKPVATDVTTAQRISTVARRTGRVCMPGHLLRFSRAHIALKEAVDRGDIGNVVALHARRDRSARLTLDYPDESPILLTGVHDIDLALWLAGSRVESVRAVQRRNLTSQVSLVWAYLNHANGVLSSVHATYLLPKDSGSSTSDRIDVYGSAGAAFIDLSTSPPTTRPQELLGLSSRQPEAVDDDALANELEHFAGCVRTQQQSTVISLDEAVHGVAVAAAIVESARLNGEEVLL
jgi:predicted dehydrogenase